MFDRNQKKSAEWAPKKKEEKKKGKKGKGKAEDGEGREGAETDRDDDSSDEEDEEKEDEKEDEKDDEPVELNEHGRPMKEKDRKEKAKKDPLDFSQAERAGIRKVRLGTFEDTGKCKGCVFLPHPLPQRRS